VTSSEIRQQFIDFFKSKGHTFAPSAPVVPLDDPTLLFINAGMNQFKDVFLGTGTRDFTRAVNSQKCIRVSGKHNDLEEVGPSPNHHTFFEMLGNWSFGDYYKAEAIKWAWELLTDVYGLEKEKLYATVFTDDDETEELWKSETDIDPTHISRHGHKDNFWEMGETGPCGPCTELHYDLGKPAPGCDPIENDGPNTESGRYMEIWNLVFIQYMRDENKELHNLPATHVDTGAGLERVCRLLQGVTSNYETDLFSPIIGEIERRSGKAYKKDGTYEEYIPHRVIADHLRALSFAIADGALPGNEGRGYVLRRILRRASRFIRELGIKGPFLVDLVPVLIEVMGDHYTELKQRQKHIETVIRAEEEAFGRTLDKGLAHFNDMVVDGKIAGADAFKLYDTFGFPLDLTEQMARERGIEVDVKGFQVAMEKAKDKSRAASRFVIDGAEFEVLSEGKHSEFVGYDELSIRTSIKMVGRVSDDNNESEHAKVSVVLEKTPFYAESGGQVTDFGTIRGKELHLKVYDVRQEGDRRVHYCEILRLPEDKSWPAQVEAAVDIERRRNILPHHTTTHLLQAALREVLGDHVTQAGSRVTPDYMTFDFTHFEKVTPEQIQEVEAIVNRNILKNYSVGAAVMGIAEAKEAGAMALFGEKYGDVVRVITIGNDGDVVSRELCGGTHMTMTGEAGLFRIESESAVSAGVRRMECTSGKAAYEKSVTERLTLGRMQDIIGNKGSDPAEKLEKMMEKTKGLEKEIERLKKAALQGAVDFIGDWSVPLSFKDEEILLVPGVYDIATDRDALQAAGDKIAEEILKAGKEGIGVVGAPIDKTFMFVCVVTKGLIQKGVKAGQIVGLVAKKAGGGGGGKPDFATAGSKNIDLAQTVLRDKDQVVKVVKDFIATI